MNDYTCEIEDPPGDATVEATANGLRAHDVEMAGEIPYESVGVVGRSEDGKTVGGLTGTIGGGWMYVHMMWVSPECRGRGLGSALLAAAEQETVRRGCPRVFLNTLSFQAPGFYERNGYTQFAALEESPAPHSRIFFRKDLCTDA